ncbi:MAG: NADPH-dependent curcumin reductase CurA [Myxococcota bacterium]|jgi:NADPH-dependent curcumin reductase CurA
MTTNRQIRLLRRPEGALTPDIFALSEEEAPTPGPGEVLCRIRYISLDASNRAWLDARPTYKPPVAVGGVMEGMTLSEVVASNVEGLAVGDLVESFSGWQDYAVHPGNMVRKIPEGAQAEHALSVLGITGLTAYFGLFDIGKILPGERVLISAAAGAVGSIAGQIAKQHGCTVIGSAGTDEKCRWLTEELGFDGAINYKTEDLGEALSTHFPKGIDVYFDNVGGPMLQQALLRMRTRGRVVCCGSISSYDGTNSPGMRGVPQLLVVKRLRMEGFIVMDYFPRRVEAERALMGWIADGSVKNRVDIIEGLDRAPEALIGLLAGTNIGKRMVKV